jgi:hypothetical protein
MLQLPAASNWRSPPTKDISTKKKRSQCSFFAAKPSMMNKDMLFKPETSIPEPLSLQRHSGDVPRQVSQIVPDTDE